MTEKEKPRVFDIPSIISKVVAGLLIMVATFLGTSTASKSYVNDTFEARIAPIRTQLQNMNDSLIKIKKDSCYARQNLARLVGDPVKDCASDV
jgi:hypothetical protein